MGVACVPRHRRTRALGICRPTDILMTMMGAVERGGGVFTQLLDGVTERHLTPFLTRNVALLAQLVTDGLTGYSHMDRHFARHPVIGHNDA